ncbi:MAG: hypothetical protein ACJ8BC_18620 [Gemmatimonadales bacterium]
MAGESKADRCVGRDYKLTANAHPGLRLSEALDGDGALILKRACVLGLEGIVSKRRDAPYRSGRSRTWLKVKCEHYHRPR